MNELTYKVHTDSVCGHGIYLIVNCVKKLHVPIT